MKNNKKGFTLIELLAVIVILAIIALIATPIVMDTIEKAKKSAAERSAENYIRAVENAVVQSAIDGNKITNGTYNIDTNGNLTNGTNTYPIDVTGEKPKSGKITIENKEVSNVGTIVVMDGYDHAISVSNDGKAVASSYKLYSDGEIVYFNPITGSKCSNYNSANSNSEYKGTSPVSPQTSCLKWYAFLDDGSDNLNLILDHNTTRYGEYGGMSENGIAADKAINQLKVDTSAWAGVTTRTDTYTNTVKNDTGDFPYTLDYSNSKARLISAQEVATIAGLDYDESTSDLGYNDYAAYHLPENYSWLGGEGYYTSTPNPQVFNAWTIMALNAAWRVGPMGLPNNDFLTLDLANADETYYPHTDSGIRPVITIKKEKIK